MVIEKQLKNVGFGYDEDKKEFWIDASMFSDHGGWAVLNKVYTFAFVRFVLRIAQRNFLRQIKK